MEPYRRTANYEWATGSDASTETVAIAMQVPKRIRAMNPETSDAVWGIVLNLTAVLIAFLLKRFVHKIVRLALVWQSFLVIVLFILLILAGYVPLLVVLRSVATGKSFDPSALIIVPFVLIAQFTILFALARLKRQYGKTLRPWGKKVGSSQYKIKVTMLYGKGLDVDEQLDLSWETIRDGAGFLSEQIRRNAKTFDPDLCVGINSGGIFIASYIAGAFRGGSRAFCYVQTVKVDEEHMITQETIPTGKEIHRILVADSEVKTGGSIRKVTELLKTKFGPGISIKVAGLVACFVRGEIESIDELSFNRKGIFTEEVAYLPDFLAFTSDRRIELPGGIR